MRDAIHLRARHTILKRNHKTYFAGGTTLPTYVNGTTHLDERLLRQRERGDPLVALGVALRTNDELIRAGFQAKRKLCIRTTLHLKKRNNGQQAVLSIGFYALPHTHTG